MLAALAVPAGGWLLLVSPERDKAAKAQTQVQSARQQLAAAQAQVSSARDAQAQYTTALYLDGEHGHAVPRLRKSVARL